MAYYEFQLPNMNAGSAEALGWAGPPIMGNPDARPDDLDEIVRLDAIRRN